MKKDRDTQIDLSKTTESVATQILVKIVTPKTTGERLISWFEKEGWKVTQHIRDGYMNLDGIGGDYSTWRVSKDDHILNVFWSREWWILDVSKKELTPKDYQ